MKKKKVLFVIRTLRDGGAERALSNIVSAFPDDWETDILLNDENLIDFPCKGNIISMGMTDTLEKMYTPSWVFFEIIKRARFLRKLKKNNDYLACISFLDSSNISNILSGNKYCRTIISIRCSLTQQKQSRTLMGIIVKFLYNKADRIVAVSRGIAAELIKGCGIKDDKVRAVENGYFIEKIVQQSKEPLDDGEEELFQNNKIFLAAGRLTEQKAFWHLIRAFSKVHEKDPKTVLFILGRGDLQDYLSELIHAYGLDRNVILKGFVDNSYKYMARADIYVMPSMYEGFPNAMAEAMCLGIPCIAADFRTGARELLEPGLIDKDEAIENIRYAEYGIITPLCSGKKYHMEELEESEQMLAKAMEELCSDDEKRAHYAEQSRKRSRELGIGEVVKRWISVIEE